MYTYSRYRYNKASSAEVWKGGKGLEKDIVSLLIRSGWAKHGFTDDEVREKNLPHRLLIINPRLKEELRSSKYGGNWQSLVKGYVDRQLR